MKHLYLLTFLSMILSMPVGLYALDAPSEMLSQPQQEERAEVIGSQLRCLVCQNESIEDSSATLARDLRHIVRMHVAQGEDNRTIMNWMVNRYGQFIRLQPALSLKTFILWSMPVCALLVGLLCAFFYYRYNKPQSTAPLTQEENKKLDSFYKNH